MMASSDHGLLFSGVSAAEGVRWRQRRGDASVAGDALRAERETLEVLFAVLRSCRITDLANLASVAPLVAPHPGTIKKVAENDRRATGPDLDVEYDVPFVEIEVRTLP